MKPQMNNVALAKQLVKKAETSQHELQIPMHKVKVNYFLDLSSENKINQQELD